MKKKDLMLMEYNLVQAMTELEDKLVLKLVEEALAEGSSSESIRLQLQDGMEKVGELYENGEYFIADLIMSGIIFTKVMQLNRMKLGSDQLNSDSMGKLLIGTVKDDLHDIGKNIFSSMMEAKGFQVYDLGTDVAPQTFVKAMLEWKPDIVGISATLTTIVENLRKTVNEIHESRDEGKPKIIIGGIALQGKIEINNADALTKDVIEAVNICTQWRNVR